MIPAGGGGQPPYAVTQQQGFMPVHQPSGMMSAQPMMQGQVMMPYQTLIPGNQFPVQPPMFNPQLNQGYLVRAPGITPQPVIPPPQYTPQMAQEYRAKQSQHPGQQINSAEEQRKQMDNLLRQRQFEDQQKRLKEFSSIGGRKMDANSMIESIIGRAAPVKSQIGKNTATASLKQNNAANMRDNTEDDGFGDFISGPTKSTSVQPRIKTENYLPGQQMPVASSNQSVVTADTQKVSEANSPNESANRQQIPEPAPVSKEQKKDLMAMMLECSDLTAPQKAKGFVKKCVKEVQPVKKHAVSYQESQKAHKWDQSADTLTELFTLPDGSMPGSVFKPPKWVTGVAPVPEVYTLVLEASIVDGMINTERLYPILLRSNLPRETLGQLWALCNKTTPGQLIKEELYLLLAMISIAQNNLDYSSLEILTRCPQAPVPNLGQHVPSVDPSVGQTDPAGHTPSGGPLNVPAAPAPAPSPLADIGNISNGNGTVNVGDDDFSDFQSGPTVVGPAAQLGGYGDSASSATVASNFRNGSSVPSENPTASTEHTSIRKGEKDEDIDEYFKNMQASSASSSRTSNNIELIDPFKKNSKSKCNVSVKPISAIYRLETTFPVSSDTEAVTTNTDAALPDFDSFAAFPGSQSESSSSQSQGWASSSSLSGVTSASSNIDDIADFASAGTATPADEFADFQQAPSIGITPDKGTDKISALKALIMNKALYLEKPKVDLKPVLDDDTVNESDWNTFSSADGQEGLADGCSSPGHENITPVAQPNATMGFFSDSIALSMNEKKQNDWAVFITPTKPGPDLTAAVGLESSPVTEKKQYESIPCDKRPKEDSEKEERLKVDKAKSEKLFQKNLSNTAAGLVVPTLAAFELVPPELPEVKDDDDGDEFDEFGTFQGGIAMNDATSEGISALAMGLDDLPDFNFVNAKSSQLPSQNSGMNTAGGKDTLDTISTASQEFSGWRSQTKSSQKEDTQSMNSLDLRVSHKDESPSSADCQSVSSLEFSAGDASRKSATPLDQRSVASLELKTTSDPGSDDITPDLPAGGSESVNGSTVLSQPFPCDPSKPAIKSPVDWNFDEKPRDVSELLTQGGLPAIGDRYSGLTQEPQDTDKHTYYWQCCLEKNKQVLTMAMEIFQSVSGSDIAEEIVNSEKGSQYMKGIVEIYRVFCRIKQAMKCFSISNHKLERLVEVIEDTWASLTIFIANTPLMPERAALDFSKDVLKTECEDNQKKACGVCVLNVDMKSELSNFNNQHKLTYGGRQYHSSCANFWVNCVDSTLPSLSIPELL